MIAAFHSSISTSLDPLRKESVVVNEGSFLIRNFSVMFSGSFLFCGFVFVSQFTSVTALTKTLRTVDGRCEEGGENDDSCVQMELIASDKGTSTRSQHFESFQIATRH